MENKNYTHDKIREECEALCTMLQRKNASYGDSALSPIRCFSKADGLEQIKVRLDDKLSRLMRGNGEFDEDVVLDILGYLILMRIAVKRRAIDGECQVKVKPTRIPVDDPDAGHPDGELERGTGAWVASSGPSIEKR